jgi:lysophospholipase L1-like esterase
LKGSFANILSRGGLQIANYSHFGSTVRDGMNLLLRRAARLDDYIFTLLEFGGNDCDYNWEDVSRAPEAKHLCKTPVFAFPAEYKALIDAVRSIGGRPVLLTLPPVDEKRYFARISKGLNADNILRFLGSARTIFTWQEKYSGIVASLAKNCDVMLVDVRAAFLAQRDYRDSLCEDGIHPNGEGHRLISEVLRSELPLSI